MYTPSLYAAFLAALTFDSVSAHMEMSWPPPLRSKKNPFAGSDIDYSMTTPLSASGSDYPCKGTLGLLGTAAAAPVASWQAGQTYNLTIEGGANHNGGSCQGLLSFRRWQDVQGRQELCRRLNLPTAPQLMTHFVPTTLRLPSTRCSPGPGSTRLATRDFPNPGASVAKANSKTAPPVGSCGSAAGGGGGGDTGASPDQGNAPNPGDGAPPASSPSKTSANPVPTTPATAPEQPGSGPVTTSTTLPGGVFIPQPSPEAPEETVITPPAETGTAPPPAKPTTLATVTTTAGTGSAPKPTSTPGSGAGNGTNAGVQKPGVACANEGQWNCVGGSQFQRCASGLWSVLMQMAPGTSCETSISEALVMIRTSSRVRRFVSPRYLDEGLTSPSRRNSSTADSRPPPLSLLKQQRLTYISITTMMA
ncbi:conserved hypothetical protein [Verticillium alfalfae VaMs.102]|uniref:Uncharacterized protein n=1 Tax=Verticillium alfalfae (strain VaMs.102 / ATCC MYA-4576 / FGSC 10136) TaxID=526221 RepID=C9SAB4_VERA1|nr:conserved hypothetical protein [Verticillium alfalfae VaMs.102]EEY15391.1 conserved hypothetical protein [Verticillium alfalfae VaMs.102]